MILGLVLVPPGRVVRGVLPVRAVHRRDGVPWELQQPHDASVHRDEGSVAAEVAAGKPRSPSTTTTPTGNFSAAERDPVTKREIRRTIRDARPLRDLAARVNAHAGNDDSLTGEERKLVAQFVDLLDKMFAYDPESESRRRRGSRTRSRRRVDVLFTTLRRKMVSIITRTRDVVHVLAKRRRLQI